MTVRVGINGFGRMGKLALRNGWGSPELEDLNKMSAKSPDVQAAELELGLAGIDRLVDLQLDLDDMLGRDVASEPAGIEIGIDLTEVARDVLRVGGP